MLGERGRRPGIRIDDAGAELNAFGLACQYGEDRKAVTSPSLGYPDGVNAGLVRRPNPAARLIIVECTLPVKSNR